MPRPGVRAGWILAGCVGSPARVALSNPCAGAAATVNTLKVISASSAMFAPIKAVVLMGDPEHRPGKHANVDEDGGHTNNNATGSEHAGTGIPTWWDDSGKVMDICYKVWCNDCAVRQRAHAGCRATACARAMGSRHSITTMPTTRTRRRWPPSSWSRSSSENVPTHQCFGNLYRVHESI
jgi:hypothetical protein